jgi:glycosyltransferase involved in cell wall biosynthesis
MIEGNTVMGNDIFVSIVIPVFNVEKYVGECLESVISQTYRNIEIVVVNDGSTDNSLQVCKEYSDSRIIIINKENGGLSDARNKGVEASKGDYIVFIDSDDVIHEELVEELVRDLKEYDCDASGCDMVSFSDAKEIPWDNDVRNVQVWNANELMSNLVGSYTSQLTTAPFKLYKREVVATNPFPAGRIHEDEFTAYRILSCCKRYAYSSKRLYGYRTRCDSIMATYNLKAEQDRIDAKYEIFDFYSKNIVDERARSRAYFLMLRNMELSYFEIFNVDRNISYLKELENKFKIMYMRGKNFQKHLNHYEKLMINLFYYFRPGYILIEKIKRKL